jgi:Transposase DDE domain
MLYTIFEGVRSGHRGGSFSTFCALRALYASSRQELFEGLRGRPGTPQKRTRWRWDPWNSEDYGTELIPPNRRGRKRRTQDGRKLRRYRKCWKVERLCAWMHNFRRLVTQWEYHIENFLGFVHLFFLHLLLKHL